MSDPTPDDTREPARQLLTRLAGVIGDHDAIADEIGATCQDHPDDWGHVLLTALALTFGNHVRLDPEQHDTDEQ